MLFVVVFSASGQLESSNDGCDSNDSGEYFQRTLVKSGGVIGAGPGSGALVGSPSGEIPSPWR